MKIKILYYGVVTDLMENKEISVENVDELKVVAFPFIEGHAGDRVLIIGIKKENETYKKEPE